MDTLGNEKVAKSCDQKFSCLYCDYSTCRKSSFDKHLITLKHQKVANGNILELQKLQNDTEKLQKVAKSCKQTIFTCEFCDKEFAHRSGLWKHKKNCNFEKHSHSNIAVQSGAQITTELVMELIKDNKEMKQIILEQNTTISNLVKNGINSHNNTKFIYE